LKALALALGVALVELAPPPDAESAVQRERSEVAGLPAAEDPAKAEARSRVAAREAPSLIRIEDLGTEMHLVLDQRVPWDKAIQILQVLKAQ
jgi:hypothetical protein